VLLHPLLDFSIVLPACEADFVPTQVKVLIRKHFDDLLEQGSQKVPGGFHSGVDGTKLAGDNRLIKIYVIEVKTKWYKQLSESELRYLTPS